MQKIVPNLWYDSDAEEAMRFYASLLPGSRIGRIARYPGAGQEIHGRPEGSAMTVEATLGDARVVALNGGPHFRFTPAASFYVVLDSEAEVDRVWSALVEGGSVAMPLDRYEWSSRYGWLADRWGLNWQIGLGSREDVGRTLTPALMFSGDRAGQTAAALEHYVAVLPGSDITALYRHDGSRAPESHVKFGMARLAGDPLIAMDSPDADDFAFTEAFSLMALCDDQAEIDRLWAALSSVPAAEQCGWLKDRFGVSWQIAPRALDRMFASADGEQGERLMAALLSMKKLDLAALERAFHGAHGSDAA